MHNTLFRAVWPLLLCVGLTACASNIGANNGKEQNGLAVSFEVPTNGKSPPIDAIPEEFDGSAIGDDKIVNGLPAEIGEFPFQVALIASWTPVGLEFDGFFCGGTYLKEGWVLTAAHCVHNVQPEKIDIIFGALDFADPETAPLRFHSQAILEHEQFGPNFDNDIALIKVGGLLEGMLPEDIETVALGGGNWDELMRSEQETLTVIGWGRTSEGGSKSTHLMKTSVNLQPFKLCVDNYFENDPPYEVTENMFCAGELDAETDSCKGDSGGFIGRRNENGQFAQVGIVSWGEGCAREGLFGVYTQLRNYWDWIDQRIGLQGVRQYP